MDDHQQLLPGIPDNICLREIAPKLPWRTFHILSSVSLAWKRAIQSRAVYDARVRSGSTEVVVVINSLVSERSEGIGIYSARDKTFCLLPPIPDEELRIPYPSKCVALDGKVYVLGVPDDRGSRRRMYVMDLAGQGRWEICASMTYGRSYFGCGVLDGKIFAVGGLDDGDGCGQKPVSVPEVYDQELGVWSPLKPSSSFRISHDIIVLGNELFLQGGYRFNPKYFDQKDLIFNDPDDLPDDYHLDGGILEVYNQGSDEWRTVEEFVEKNECLFVANGKFHSISDSGIRVHDFENKSCTDRHSFSSANITRAIGCSTAEDIRIADAVAVENEVVAVVTWVDAVFGLLAPPCILQSSGFGGTGTSITWQKAEWTGALALGGHRFYDYNYYVGLRPVLCTVQL